jgi:hypothetical protein
MENIELLKRFSIIVQAQKDYQYLEKSSLLPAKDFNTVYSFIEREEDRLINIMEDQNKLKYK